MSNSPDQSEKDALRRSETSEVTSPEAAVCVGTTALGRDRLGTSCRDGTTKAIQSENEENFTQDSASEGTDRPAIIPTATAPMPHEQLRSSAINGTNNMNSHVTDREETGGANARIYYDEDSLLKTSSHGQTTSTSE